MAQSKCRGFTHEKNGGSFHSYVSLPEGKHPFSHGFPMVFPLKPPFSDGFPMDFRWFFLNVDQAGNRFSTSWPPMPSHDEPLKLLGLLRIQRSRGLRRNVSCRNRHVVVGIYHGKSPFFMGKSSGELTFCHGKIHHFL